MRACSPSPSTQETIWRALAKSVSKMTPSSASVTSPACPKWRSASQSIRSDSQMRARPIGSPSCQSVRIA